MSASCATQTAFIFYLGNPLGTTSGPYSSSCFLFRSFFPFLPFFPTTIFWICRFQFLSQGCGGLAHLLILLSVLLEPVPIQPSLAWSHCGSFSDTHPAPVFNSSQFSTSSTSSPRTMFWIFHINSQLKG